MSDLSNYVDNQNNHESMFEYDELKMYFGADYWINDKIKITQPSLGDIIEFGDVKFYSIVSTLCANTTSFRLQLWDMPQRIDWTKISDFELFTWLIRGFTTEDTYLIFGDLNLSWFKAFWKNPNDQNEGLRLIYVPRDKDGEEIFPESIDDAIIIDELIYLRIVDY